MNLDVVSRGLLPWLWDGLGGTQMRLPRAGSYSSAVYTVNANQVVIPTSAGGGKIENVRGVWKAATVFTWDGYYSGISSGDATNYYTGGSYVNNPSNTVITLGAGLANGTQVQVFYWAADGIVLPKNAPWNTWPCWVDCYYNMSYAAAPDSDPKIALTAFEAVGWFGDLVQCSIGRVITQRLGEYIGFTNAPNVEDFNGGFFDRRGGSFYKVSGNGGVVDSWGVANGVMTVMATLPAASSYVIWGRAGVIDITTANKILIRFAGTFSQKRFAIMLKSPDATEYYAAIPDFSLEFSDFALPLTGFLRKNKLVYDGDRRFDDPAWWTWGDGDSSGSVNDHYLNTIEGGIPRYFGKRLPWSLGMSGTEFQFGVDVPSGVDSTGTANINLYIKTSVATKIFIKVMDALDKYFVFPELWLTDGYHGWWPVGQGVDINEAWQRLTIPWASFQKDDLPHSFGGITHPVKKVILSARPPSYSGTLYLADIRFDTPENVKAKNEIDVYQFEFPKTGTFTGKWDSVGFDNPTTTKTHGLAIRFSYQWDNLAQPLGWQGPAYTGYQVPAVFYKRAAFSIAEAQADFLKAAQDEYANRYGVVRGPFMPVYLVDSQENKEYGTLDTWTWNGPDPNTDWGGFQYRALAALAHYYFLSGNATAKTVLDNWMAWLDTRITDVGVGDGVHHNYETPGVFVKDTGTYTSYYSPYFHALIAEAMIFKYWRDGDSIALTWYRKLLDDLVYNRVATSGAKAGSWVNGIYTYGFENAEAGVAFGMLINGRQGGVVNYPLAATTADVTAFGKLYQYFTSNIRNAKPCALAEDTWLPLHAYESFLGQFIADSAVTSEGVAACYGFALDYAKHSGNHAWLNRLKDFIKSALGV